MKQAEKRIKTNKYITRVTVYGTAVSAGPVVPFSRPQEQEGEGEVEGEEEERTRWSQHFRFICADRNSKWQQTSKSKVQPHNNTKLATPHELCRIYQPLVNRKNRIWQGSGGKRRRTSFVSFVIAVCVWPICPSARYTWTTWKNAHFNFWKYVLSHF